MSEDQLRALEKQRQEHKLGILLVAISILFILCQSFKMIPDLYEIMYCESIANCESTPFVTFCVNLSHLLVCFNSSANFVIYLLGGEKFRRAWCQTYLCRKADSSHTRFVYSIRVPSKLEVYANRNLDHGLRHGLWTPNEGINQRNLKIWANVADKICFGRT